MNGPVQQHNSHDGTGSYSSYEHRVGGPSVWRVVGNITATTASRLPSAVLGAVFGIEVGVILGPIGMLLAAGWLLAGLATGTPLGERALARVVLRYRPADGSWLEAEVRRLAPGRRVRVYVAPKASGVVALGGHTIGLGELSVGSGAPTPALLQATSAAVLELRSGKTRPELPLLWLSLPWWFAREVAVREAAPAAHAAAAAVLRRLDDRWRRQRRAGRPPLRRRHRRPDPRRHGHPRRPRPPAAPARAPSAAARGRRARGWAAGTVWGRCGRRPRWLRRLWLWALEGAMSVRPATSTTSLDPVSPARAPRRDPSRRGWSRHRWCGLRWSRNGPPRRGQRPAGRL